MLSENKFNVYLSHMPSHINWRSWNAFNCMHTCINTMELTPQNGRRRLKFTQLVTCLCWRRRVRIASRRAREHSSVRGVCLNLQCMHCWQMQRHALSSWSEEKKSLHLFFSLCQQYEQTPTHVATGNHLISSELPPPPARLLSARFNSL